MTEPLQREPERVGDDLLILWREAVSPDKRADFADEWDAAGVVTDLLNENAALRAECERLRTNNGGLLEGVRLNDVLLKEQITEITALLATVSRLRGLLGEVDMRCWCDQLPGDDDKCLPCRIAAELEGRADDDHERGCRWVADDDGVYQAGCGNTWLFEDGTPAENGAQYCPCCGKPLVHDDLEPGDFEDGGACEGAWR